MLRLRRVAILNAAASHSVEQHNSFGGRLLRLAIIGRPQLRHDDGGHHFSMQTFGGLEQSSQTRKIQADDPSAKG